MEIAVLGRTEFTLGFGLSGIRHIKTITGEAAPHFAAFMANETIGVILTDQASMNSLSENTREEIAASVQPVVVVIGEEGGQEELRKMIKKSIGVDLWAE